MATSFPILRLPNKIIRNVVENLSFYNQLTFSLCSKATKSCVTPLRHKIRKINITVDHPLKIHIFSSNSVMTYLSFYKYNFDLWNVQSCGSIIATEFDTNFFGTESVREIKGFGLRDCIDHIMEIFNHSKIFEVHINGVMGIQNLKRVCEAMKGLTARKIFLKNWTDEIVQNVICSIQHKGISFNKKLISNSSSLNHEILVRNFFSFSASFPEHNFNLNDLLIMNSTHLRIRSSQLAFEDLNIFLKHLKTGLNQTLIGAQFLKIPQGPAWDDVKVLMNGIPHSRYRNSKLVSQDDNYQSGDCCMINQDDERRISLTWKWTQHDGSIEIAISCDSVTVPKTMLENCINNDQHKKITYFSLFPERHLMPNHKIHCLNLGSVSYELPGRGKNLQLDDVLLMNCSKLCLFPCKLSSQELNIFIRLYIAQPNRQLETVELHRTNEGIWKVEDSMKGISYSIWNKNPGNNHKLEKRIKFTQNDETMMHLDWKLDSIRCSTVITIE
eukprot:NP_494355.1 F-box B protein [Caenorhabditis elegans]